MADDDATNRRVAQCVLQKLGYRVDVVEDGRAAVETAGEGDYAAILMDCLMPVMDGFEATAAIRELQGSSCHTPIIAMTASSMSGDRERCLEAGMDDYVSKPMRPAALAEVLERCGIRPPCGPPSGGGPEG